MTNAQKAAIITLVNSALALAMVFGVPISDLQAGAVSLFANSAMGAFVALTYKNSPRRIPDFPSEDIPESDFA